jgi:hypothetical protein
VTGEHIVFSLNNFTSSLPNRRADLPDLRQKAKVIAGNGLNRNAGCMGCRCAATPVPAGLVRYRNRSLLQNRAEAGELMPLEAISCTNCGSGQVQEVKPNTYFCDHCEAVFKYIPPGVQSAGHVPQFCAHGNPITVQCQVCRTGICRWQCDVVSAWQANKYSGYIQTTGYGYLEQRQVFPGSGSSGIEGLFIGLDKLLASLALSFNGRLSHACYTCVTAAVPAAAEHIASGAICEMLLCDSPPSATCPCCRGAFCEKCSMPQVAEERGAFASWIGRYCSRPALPGFRPDPSFWGSRTSGVRWAPPKGMCASCANEHGYAAARFALDICRRDYANQVRAVDGGTFAVGGPAPRRQKHYYEERTKAEALADRYAADTSEKLAKVVTLNGTCKRDAPIREGAPSLASYRITDERIHIAPAATSAVMWARTFQEPW